MGETSEEFYQNIYTGQHFILSAAAASRNAQRQPSFNNNRISDPQEGGPPWTCRMCTFSNHPLLSMCEQCGMIRPVRRGTSPTSEALNELTILSKLGYLPTPSGSNNNNSNHSNNNNEFLTGIDSVRNISTA